MDVLGSFCAIVSEILSVTFCLKVTSFISSKIHETFTVRQVRLIWFMGSTCRLPKQHKLDTNFQPDAMNRFTWTGRLELCTLPKVPFRFLSPKRTLWKVYSPYQMQCKSSRSESKNDSREVCRKLDGREYTPILSTGDLEKDKTGKVKIPKIRCNIGRWLKNRLSCSFSKDSVHVALFALPGRLL